MSPTRVLVLASLACAWSWGPDDAVAQRRAAARARVSIEVVPPPAHLTAVSLAIAAAARDTVPAKRRWLPAGARLVIHDRPAPAPRPVARPPGARPSRRLRTVTIEYAAN